MFTWFRYCSFNWQWFLTSLFQFPSSDKRDALSPQDQRYVSVSPFRAAPASFEIVPAACRIPFAFGRWFPAAVIFLVRDPLPSPSVPGIVFPVRRFVALAVPTSAISEFSARAPPNGLRAADWITRVRKRITAPTHRVAVRFLIKIKISLSTLNLHVAWQFYVTFARKSTFPIDCLRQT